MAACVPINPLNADPEYTRVQSVFFSIFVCKINVLMGEPR